MSQGHLWRRRQKQLIEANDRHLRATMDQLRLREAEIQTRINTLQTHLKKIEDIRQDRLTHFNQTLASMPAPVLSGHAFAPVAGIKHPAAALALIRHYKDSHTELTPSLEWLERELAQLPQDAKTKALDVITHRVDELRDWCKSHEGELVQYASAAYSANQLSNNLQQQPRPTPETINLKDHRWLAENSTAYQNEHRADAVHIHHVLDNLESLGQQLSGNDTANRLINDVKLRSKQLLELQETLALTNDRKLLNEYQQQLAHYSAALNALHNHGLTLTRANCVKRNVEFFQSPGLKALGQAKDHFYRAQTGKLTYNTKTGVITHYEYHEYRNGTLHKTVATDKDGKPLKATKEDMLAVLEQMSKEYADMGLSHPVRKGFITRGYLFNIRKSIKNHKDGSITIPLRPEVKEDYLNRLNAFVQGRNEQNRKLFDDRPASARQVGGDPAASATQVSLKPQ